MSRRIMLHIDKIVHINDVTLEIYRSLNPDVIATGTKVMSIFEPSAIKETRTQEVEKLTKDTVTPYAFYAARHFEDVPLPKVFIADNQVDPRDLVFFSDEKMLEIHNGDLGLNDGRSVYLTYDYKSIEVMDDYGTISGVTYSGPPATGLRVPFDAGLEQDFDTNRLRIFYTENRQPVVFYYRIQGRDSDGNKSAYSQSLNIELTPEDNDIFYRIERSMSGSLWEPVSFSNMFEWFDEIKVVEKPINVTGVEMMPLNSKEISLTMDNPWYTWQDLPRTGYHYRVRAEDRDGETTDWVYLDPIIMHIRPKGLLIRRKVDNGAVSSEKGDDAIDVFYLTADRVDPTQPTLTLIDDQLSEALKYGYTFFFTDELNLPAVPSYYIGDLTPWANIILFKGQKKSDNIRDPNFIMAFELANRIIEIGLTP